MKCYIKDYPRPQFVRRNWENLNGTWDFAFDDANCGEKARWYQEFKATHQIQVPFTYETKLSGIQDETVHKNVWYRKTVTVDGSKLEKNDYILYFEGSDYVTKLWVNGQFAGSHKGGYSRFSFDITNLVNDGENELVVKVEDSLDMQQTRGKQRWMPQSYGCWYVQTTGIWKTVWAEYAPKVRLESVKMTPNIEDYTLELEIKVNAPEELYEGQLLVETNVSFKDHFVTRNFVDISSGCVRTVVDMLGTKTTKAYDNFASWTQYWSPANPNLYDLEFRLIRDHEVLDEIGSYVGMRTVRVEGSNVLLNNEPLYQRLILDQGYWKDSHLTPPSEEALIEDIDKIHAMGYNGLRKHQKVEDERFLYWCDVKGMLVWSEMAAAYRYTDQAIDQFTREWLDVVQQNYNHSCIVTWTPINESWGVAEIKTHVKEQHFTEAIYHLTKSIDKMRPVIVNDGWEHTVSDIFTLHDYEEFGKMMKERYTTYKDEILAGKLAFNIGKCSLANGYSYKGQPVLMSEFGGIAFNNDDSGWGYGNKVNTKEDFIRRFDDITTAVKEIPYMCGYCYTQVTDVQQEINGLMDIDRNFKVDPEILKEINERRVDCRWF